VENKLGPLGNAMTLDVVNSKKEKVDSVELSDDVFSGTVNMSLIWEAVVHENASDRQGTHATKTRGLVKGSGKKMWRQKGTGRARASDAANPLWRAGGTVHGPQPRSYGYRLPKKMVRGALRAALSQKIKDGAVLVVDGPSTLVIPEPRTKLAVERLSELGVSGRTVLVDVVFDHNLELAAQNIPRVRLIETVRLTARDVVGAKNVVLSKSALERLAQVVG
jgi:large subunit ribosomal protein L4